MSYDFSANDIFDIAEQIEKNGAIFYRNAAATVNDKNDKAYLLALANMEDEHKETFKKMRQQLSKSEMATTVFDPDNETLAYLKALADMRVFFEKEMDISSLESILKSAIIAEKDSIVFYLGMKALVPKTKGKVKINEIISEEMAHIKSLTLHLKKLKI